MSRKKEVGGLQTTEVAGPNIRGSYINSARNRPSGRVAAEIKGVSKAFGDLKVVHDFSAIVNRNEKIVLVGRNGLGKTTMLKALLSDAPSVQPEPAALDSGSGRWGPKVSIGY